MDQPSWIFSLVFPKPLTVWIGNRIWRDHRISPHMVLILRKNCVFNTVKKICDQRRTASSSTLQLACSTGRCQPTFVWFSTGMGTVQVAGATQWCWPRLLGRKSFLIGVPACCAQSYEEIGQVLDMLVDALGQGGFVLNGAKKKSRRRANIQQYFHLQAW